MKVRSLLPTLWGQESGPLQSLKREIDEIFSSWANEFPPAELPWSRSEFAPSVNVSETEKEISVTAELPGVDEKNIDVTVAGDQLTIRGEKKSEVDEKKEEKGRTFRRVERSYGSFQRSMSLPYEIDPDNVQAIFKNGVLTLTIPKPLEVQRKAKKIEVKGDKQPIESKKAA
jgi:HSP20 family protein